MNTHKKTKRRIKRHIKRLKDKRKAIVKQKLRDQTCDNCKFFVKSRYHESCRNSIRNKSSGSGIPNSRTCRLWQQGDTSEIHWQSHDWDRLRR